MVKLYEWLNVTLLPKKLCSDHQESKKMLNQLIEITDCKELT